MICSTSQILLGQDNINNDIIRPGGNHTRMYAIG